MRAAAQRRSVKPRRRQHALDTRDMCRLAAMRGAGERQLLLAEAVTICRTRFQERQRLERLDGGARKYRRRNVADGEHRLAVRVGDSDRAAMPALDQRPAHDFDKDRITHDRS